MSKMVLVETVLVIFVQVGEPLYYILVPRHATNQDVLLTNTCFYAQLYGRHRSQNCQPEDSIKPSIVTSFLKTLNLEMLGIDIIAQSICTHYSCFKNQGLFVTLKKNRPSCFLKKPRCKKTKVIVIQKEKRQPGLFSV
jgi:hypothetical protein